MPNVTMRHADGEVRLIADMGDGDTLNVTLTHEGIIIDAVMGGEVVGTEARDFAVIFDNLTDVS